MKNPVFCAIDTTDLTQAENLSKAVAPHVGGIKLGLEFFCAHGAAGINKARRGLPLFLDLKFHDIPNTVAGAVRAIAPLKPDFLTVHAAGGQDMIRAAKNAAPPETKILAVTVLTSLDDADLEATGQRSPAQEQVLRLAALAQTAGADGVVCSAQEISTLRNTFGKGLTLMVPGIRPAGAQTGDQKRTMTPPQALAAGADYLVIGRPITQSADPATAAQKIAQECRADNRA